MRVSKNRTRNEMKWEQREGVMICSDNEFVGWGLMNHNIECTDKITMNYNNNHSILTSTFKWKLLCMYHRMHFLKNHATIIIIQTSVSVSPGPFHQLRIILNNGTTIINVIRWELITISLWTLLMIWNKDYQSS